MLYLHHSPHISTTKEICSKSVIEIEWILQENDDLHAVDGGHDYDGEEIASCTGFTTLAAKLQGNAEIGSTKGTSKLQILNPLDCQFPSSLDAPSDGGTHAWAKCLTERGCPTTASRNCCRNASVAKAGVITARCVAQQCVAYTA